MTNTQAYIFAAVANKPKGYKTRFCGTYLNGKDALGESRALRILRMNKDHLVHLLIDYPEISITLFGTLVQIDYRHARILACLIHNNWTFMEKNVVDENYNYVIPNDIQHYILSTLGNLLNEPINTHKEFV